MNDMGGGGSPTGADTDQEQADNDLDQIRQGNVNDGAQKRVLCGNGPVQRRHVYIVFAEPKVQADEGQHRESDKDHL